MTDGWVVVVPVKDTSHAKSRLAAPYPGAEGIDPEGRQRLAIAFALDTVDAALSAAGVAHVVAVTGDSTCATAIRALGADVMRDPGGGLNPAIEAGIVAAGLHYPGSPVAVLTADLPSLRAEDLAEALRLACAVSFALVPDLNGTGTTLITALTGTELAPRFGTGSAVAHRKLGHIDLGGAVAERLRRDVDTLDDLAAACGLGLGHRSHAALHKVLEQDASRGGESRLVLQSRTWL
jgi:2-phospho-L-lactate guanylyltransferase